MSTLDKFRLKDTSALLAKISVIGEGWVGMFTLDRFRYEDASALLTKMVLIGAGLVGMLTADKLVSYFASSPLMKIPADAVPNAVPIDNIKIKNKRKTALVSVILHHYQAVL